MKRHIIILSVIFLVLYGCSNITYGPSSCISSVTSNTSLINEGRGGNDGYYSDCTCPPGERWRHEVSYTFIKYVGTKEHEEFSRNYAAEVKNGTKSYCNYFVEFLKYFNLTSDEFLTVVEMENKQMVEIGEPIEYDETGVRYSKNLVRRRKYRIKRTG